MAKHTVGLLMIIHPSEFPPDAGNHLQTAEYAPRESGREQDIQKTVHHLF
jgi:hypothetical protein